MDKRGNLSAASLFGSFFKVGAFTFGGGVAMLPVIEREVVEQRKWLSTEEFIDVLAIAQSGPGAIAVNTAILTGHKLLGLKGVAAATAGVVAPSFFIILLIAALLPQAGQSPMLNAFFMGVRPAVVALIAAAAIKLGQKILVDKFSIALAGITLLISLLLNPHPAVLIPIAALIGLLRFFYLQKREEGSRR
ncbi:MAG: putative chromate transport protein [Firmicutes bacterium]|nr:putative chromate transport protein [candidate division NPL-UPA2 bacterium]